jgi:hypothetical protein
MINSLISILPKAETTQRWSGKGTLARFKNVSQLKDEIAWLSLVVYSSGLSSSNLGYLFRRIDLTSFKELVGLWLNTPAMIEGRRLSLMRDNLSGEQKEVLNQDPNALIALNGFDQAKQNLLERHHVETGEYARRKGVSQGKRAVKETIPGDNSVKDAKPSVNNWAMEVDNTLNEEVFNRDTPKKGAARKETTTYSDAVSNTPATEKKRKRKSTSPSTSEASAPKEKKPKKEKSPTNAKKVKAGDLPVAAPQSSTPLKATKSPKKEKIDKDSS